MARCRTSGTDAGARMTKVVIGMPTAILSSGSPSFRSGSLILAGWKAHRNCNESWFVTDPDGYVSLSLSRATN